MKAFLIALICTLLGIASAKAQVPQVYNCNMPGDYLVNEELCFTFDVAENTNVGFGPYLRIMLPPGVQLHSAVFGGGSTLALVDTSAGAPLKDPYRNSGTLADSVSLPNGWTFWILTYPVGSVSAGGVALTTVMCFLMDPAQVTIGQPLNIRLQAGYIYGGTPTGTTGPSLGPVWSGDITPELYYYKKTSGPLPRHDRTPGPSWPIVYSLSLNIANAQLLTNIVFQDDLPDSLMYVPGSLTYPTGCMANTGGLVPGVPGGSFSVTCPSGLGTLAESDMRVVYAGYATNVLDESIGGGICDEYKVINVSSVVTDQGPLRQSTDTVKVYNVTFQHDAFPPFIVPGSIVDNTINIQISDYIAAMDSFIMVVSVQDGLDFIGNSTLDGVPVTPLSIQNNYPTTGETQVTYDLVALRGGIIFPGDSLKLIYQTMVRQTYQATGAQVLARDILISDALGHYHLVDELPGTAGCDYGYRASVSVIPNSITKEVIGGTNYVPGQNIVYRLRMILPSGDANNVIFSDFLPIPIHNVNAMNLNWGGPNIMAGPNHYSGAPWPIISIDSATNALVLNFGNVASGISPETLEVYISVPVSTIPFANGLIHSNFVQVASDNTDLSTVAALQLTQIWVGSPMLTVTKGVSAIDNPHSWLTAPNAFPMSSDGINVDASDTVHFVSTIVNTGGAQAFNVKMVDPVPMSFSGCQLQGVTNGAGNPYPYHGNLFTAPNDTLVIDSMAAAGPDSIALVSYTCEVTPTAIPWQTITNTVSIAWASSMSQDSLFAWKRDSAYVRVSVPLLAKTIRGIEPGHAQQSGVAQVGEVIHYRASITIPEGVSDSLKLRDIMGSGLAYAGIDSIVVSSTDLVGSLGPIANLIPSVSSVGAGAANLDRWLLFAMGSITNNNTDNAVAEKIDIYYRARVLNTLGNVRGSTLPNDIALSWRMGNTGQTQTVSASAPLVRVAEPTLTLNQQFLTNNVAPGDSVFVTLTLAHAPLSNGNAYDVIVTDTLPLGMNFVANSFTGACPSNYSVQPGFAGSVITASWDSLPLGSTCQITFKVAVDHAYPACSDLAHRVQLLWESVADPLQAALPTCPLNTLGVERTGVATAPGQLNNYVTQSVDTLHVGVAFTGITQITGNAPVCIGNALELYCTPFVGSNVSYIWSTPQGPDTTTLPQLIIYPATPADSGYYGVTISVGGCLSQPSNVFMAMVVPAPQVFTTGNGVLCAGGDQQLGAVALPAGNYSYLWNGPNGFISNAQNPMLIQVSPAMAGNYTVQVSGGGCTSTWSAPVTLQVLPRPVVTAQSDTLECSYGIVDMVVNATAVSGVAPYTFYWTGPGGFASTMEDAIIPNAMEMHEGNYIVTMTDSMGCTSLPMTAVIDIQDAPQTPVITQQGPLCPGDQLTLVTTPYAGGNVSYHWVTPNGPFTTSVPSLNFPTVDTSHTGLYAVVATIDGCQTLMSALSTVVVQDAPVNPMPTYSYGNALNCAGDTLWLSAVGDTSHTYLWTGPNGFTGNGPRVYVPHADPSYNGSYEVTVTNGNCIQIASVTMNSLLPYPNTPFILQPLAICVGDNVLLQANAYSSANVSYTWVTPTGLQTTATPSLALQPTTMLDSGNYAVLVTVDGCNSLQSGTVALDIHNAPATPAIFMNQDTLCEGDTLLLSTTNIPGATYTWSGPAGFASSNQNPPAMPSVALMNNGVFELFVDYLGCRSGIARDTVTVLGSPTAPTLFTSTPAVCVGEPILLSTGGSCDAYIWLSPQGLNGAALGNPSQYTSTSSTVITPSDTAYLPGNWTAICVAANGCYSAPSAPVWVDITPRPAAPSITNPGSLCLGNTLALTGSSNTPNASYNWVGPNAFTYQGQSPLLYNVTAAHAGNYGLVVSAGGCPSDTSWMLVVIDSAPPMPTPLANGSACSGSALNLVANTTATAYYWTGPNGFVSTLQNPSIPNVNGSNAGYYQLTVMQAACSSAVGSVHIDVIDNNMVPVMAANGPLCAGEPLLLTASPVTGSNVQYVWTCPGPVIDTTAIPSMLDTTAQVSATGWYSLSVLIDGCPSPTSAPVHVDVRATPATPTILGSGTVCAGDDIVLATTAQADSYLWLGPNGFVSTLQQPSVITNAQSMHSGTYYLHVTAGGCTSADTAATVQVQVPGAAPSLQSNSPVCTGDTIRITATAGADAYLWTYPGGGSSTTTGNLLLLSPAAIAHSGTYTVRCLVGGCSTAASMPVAVVVSDALQENAYAGNDQLVCGATGTAMLQAANTAVNGLWTTTSGAVIVSPGHAQTLVTQLAPGMDYVFHWTLSGGGCRSASVDSVHIALAQSPMANPNGYILKSYSELLNASILVNDSLWQQSVDMRVVLDPAHGTCGTNPNHTLNYFPTPDFVGYDSLLYEVCLVECPDQCDMAWVRFEINPKLIIPDLITPNGDGVNDAFEMIGLDNYPTNQLMIYNRWGNEVYAATNYKSDWTGTYNGGPVPDGTYFWILLDTSDGTEIQRGYLTIHR